MADVTPMMKQYQEIKKRIPGAILFFRLGDFYEMFGEDAKTASRILQIALTARGAGENRKIKMPMCGVPYHAANTYIMKLINSGRKVAVCEQIGEPKAGKGIVKREVTKVISPGTVLEESALDGKKNNYLLSVFLEKNTAGIAWTDATTGEFFAAEIQKGGGFDAVLDEIEKISPSEVLMPSSYAEDREINKNFISRLKLCRAKTYINYIDDWNYDYGAASDRLKEHFKVSDLDSFGIAGMEAVASSAGAVIAYLYDTQESPPGHINKIMLRAAGAGMYIDAVSLRNLEITESSAKGSGAASLFEVLDSAKTPMGARKLKKWIMSPLTDIDEIMYRQEITAYFAGDGGERENAGGIMRDIPDLERIAGKLGNSSANARDLIALKKSIARLKELKKMVEDSDCEKLKKRFRFAGEGMENVYSVIEESIEEEPPITIKEGGIIKPSYDKELGEFRKISSSGKEWIAKLQDKERKRLNIPSLKVGYNSVFGYYIEVRKTHLKNVPEEYIRKQTLVSAERFITPGLKEYESRVLGAQEKIKNMEYEIFKKIRGRLAEYIPGIQKEADLAASLDCLVSFAGAAVNNNYTRPSVNNGGGIKIKDGRHPVIEKNMGYNEFIPNDTELDRGGSSVAIITGPNMAGKSTYMRQVAIIIIMAQAGAFVPAASAEIGVVDRIFTRVGASDYLARGLSTFMVEMIETANILNNATENSLILLDEVGRGTSTFDGVSIAWAVTEYIHDHIGAKTLFATHYYELTEIADTLEGVQNYNIQVKEYGDKIVFLRKIIKGSTDRSYGIHVGKLAGLPAGVIERAGSILRSLEQANYTESGLPKIGGEESAESRKKEGQLDLFSVGDEKIRQELSKMDIDNMTPVNALNELKKLKEKFK